MKKIILFIASFIVVYAGCGFAQTYNIEDYGAIGNGQNNNTVSVQKAIDACSETGGTVLFPSGNYPTGTVYLKSNVRIYLSQGAVWSGYPSLELYPDIPPKYPSRMDVTPWKAFIYAYDKENITITGEGMIAPNGANPVFQDNKGNSRMRPYGLHIVGCRNVTISNITMRNSAFWMQRYFYCDKLRISGIRVFNHCNFNNDGLDIDGCHDVVVSDCFIDASDDALCLKSEGMRTTENVVVNNCVLSSHASAIKCGTGSVAGFKNIAISNCVIRPSSSEEMHHPFKLWGGIAGIDLGNVDGGMMKDVNISNIVMDSVQTPIFIRLGKRFDRPWVDVAKPTHGITENISISNVTARNAGRISCAITGYPGHYVKDVTLNNINITVLGLGEVSDTSFDVPERESGYPVNRMFGSNLPSYGFYVRHAKDISFNGVILDMKKNDPRSAFVFEDVSGLYVKDFRAALDSRTQPLIWLVNTSDAFIYGSNRMDDLEELIKVKGRFSKNIYLKDNPLTDPFATFKPAALEAEAACERISFVKLNWQNTTPQEVGLNHFVIYRDGEEIARTRKQEFTDEHVNGGTEYKYEVALVNTMGDESEKATTTVEAVKDKDDPYLLGMDIINNQLLRLIFSEPLDPSSTGQIDNFELSPGASVFEVVTGINGDTIVLETTPMKNGQEYTLLIKDIKDRSVKGNTIETTEKTFTDKPLISYWSFDEGKGDKAFDGSQNTHTGIVRHAKWVEGRQGRALFFDGEKSYVDCSNPPTLNLQGDIAISVWIKLEDPDYRSFMRVLSKRKIWNAPDGYELECNPASNRLNISGGSKGPGEQGVVNFKPDNQWHHLVAMIWEGVAYIYIDGQLIGKDEKVALPDDNNVPLFIGASPNKSDFFYGTLDELRIFNRSLSENEVERLFKNR